MSIDAKEFDKHRNPSKYIIAFLRNNSDRAFAAESIAKEVGLSVAEVENALMWESLAAIVDRTYRARIEIATVKGIIYYKYVSV